MWLLEMQCVCAFSISKREIFHLNQIHLANCLQTRKPFSSICTISRLARSTTSTTDAAIDSSSDRADIGRNIGYYLVSDDLNSNASFESGSDGDVAGIEIASSSHGERADVLFDSGSDWADSADELDSGSERSTSSNELSRGRTADLKANLMDAEFRLLSAQIPKEIRLSSADRARLSALLRARLGEFRERRLSAPARELLSRLR
ncbi:hypothetical protein GN958_ATG06310 [Phytophthora infestans]|uniref:Uncharacterized protein n=1 Tax=Phytophthora infestans TaxID=4787 RepID=A0A8S9UZ60_PHYIN|nr:hypothetical protein GN958_ATG06310 [Phytophthora infestans]